MLSRPVLRLVVPLFLVVVAQAALAARVQIMQSGLSFVPGEVTIALGDTIEWRWGGGNHTVTSGTGAADPDAGEFFDAPLTAVAPVVEYAPVAAGDLPYFCRPHESFGMSGLVHVVAPDPVWAHGLPHLPLGQAQLALGAGGTLTVSNIGSSGEDGVAVDVGELDGWRVVVGNGVACETIVCKMGRVELGKLSSEHVLLSCENIGQQTLSASLAAEVMTPTSVWALLLANGVMQDAVEFAWPPPAGLVTVQTSGAQAEDFVFAGQFDAGGSLIASGAVGAGVRLAMAISGRPAVTADTFAFQFTGLPAGVPRTDGAEILMSGAPGGLAHLHAEGVIHRDIACRSFGDAHLTGVCEVGVCRLEVTNIGSSGEDGVGINPLFEEGGNVTFNPLATGAPGAAIGFGWGDPALGLLAEATLSWTGPDAFFDIWTEVSIDGGAVAAYDGGVPVGGGTFAGAPGTTIPLGVFEGGAPAIASSRWVDRVHIGGKALPVLELGLVFAGQAIFRPEIGDEVLVCDEVRVRLRYASPPLTERPKLVITGSNLPTFGIEDFLPLGTDTAVDVPTPSSNRVAVRPNPFNPRTTLVFALSRDTDARVTIHDARGRGVRTLASGRLSAGEIRLDWDGTGDGGETLPSGAYFARVTGDGATLATGRLMLVR